MKFSVKVWSAHGTTWFNFWSIRVKGVGGSKVKLFVITGHSSEALTSHYHSQQGAGFVVFVLAVKCHCCYFVRLPTTDPCLLHCSAPPVLIDCGCAASRGLLLAVACGFLVFISQHSFSAVSTQFLETSPHDVGSSSIENIPFTFT